jgi:hypothetical protein
MIPGCETYDTWERRWGIQEWEPPDMTICIAAICDNGHGIVLAADRELGIQITSGEVAGKFMPLFGDHDWKNEWAVGIAGTVANATDVIGATRGKAPTPQSFSTHDVRRIVEDAYREVRLARAEGLYLANRGYTLKEFRTLGLAGVPQYPNLDAQIAFYDHNADLIFAGWGNEGTGPAILTITNPGVATEHSVLGFWCIGTGATAARVSLFARDFSWAWSPEKTAYYLYEAKIAAQRATGVGTMHTDIHLMRKTGTPISLGEKTLEVMVRIFEELKPRDFSDTHHKDLNETSEFKRFETI